MKISLNMGQEEGDSRAAQQRVLERDVLGAKAGDWNAKNSLVRLFTPLLASLAEKRTNDAALRNQLIEAGKQGLFDAARKYKPNVGIVHFRVFALDFIEAAMDHAARASSSSGGGFLSRLFGR
jgi:DNA-directed RNA polymerase specialized sigma subunit